MSHEADYAVVVFAPVHADATTLKKIVEDEQQTAVVCLEAGEFYEALTSTVLLVIVTEEGLARCSLGRVRETLSQQQAWSNIPIIVLAGPEVRNIDTNRFVRLVEMGNVNLLLRPTTRLNLVLAIRSALHTRLLQFSIREHIKKLSAHAEQLETLVSERTQQLELEVVERRRIEQQLAETRRLESLGRLTGGIAHDFNNLLQVIVGNEALLHVVLQSSQTQLPAVQKSLESIRRAADHGASLTKQLLAYARRQPLASAVLDLRVHLQVTMEMIRRMLGPNVRLQQEVPGNLWPVFVDPAQLDSALLNLAANAHDAIGRDGLLIVRAKNRHLPDPSLPQAGELAGEFVEISLTDNGHGMSEETMQQAFDPFFTTKPIGKGTGLGLSQVYGFAKQSEGVAFIQQEVLGTTVGLLLPRSRNVAEPKELAEVLAHDRLANTRILYVEDNLEVAEITATMLQTLGATVTVVENADAAILADFSQVDVVLSDVMMPGKMDGIDLAIWVAEHYPHLSVVLASGYVVDPERLGEVRAKFVRKPYMLEPLVKVITEALQGI